MGAAREGSAIVKHDLAPAQANGAAAQVSVR
jgi:hypothetical protein